MSPRKGPRGIGGFRRHSSSKKLIKNEACTAPVRRRTALRFPPKLRLVQCVCSSARGAFRRHAKFQRSATLSLLALRDARLQQFLNQRSRQRFVQWELYGPFRYPIPRKFVLKIFDHRRGREQAAVLRKRRIPHQHFLRLERRNLVADV